MIKESNPKALPIIIISMLSPCHLPCLYHVLGHIYIYLCILYKKKLCKTRAICRMPTTRNQHEQEDMEESSTGEGFAFADIDSDPGHSFHTVQSSTLMMRRRLLCWLAVSASDETYSSRYNALHNHPTIHPSSPHSFIPILTAVPHHHLLPILSCQLCRPRCCCCCCGPMGAIVGYRAHPHFAIIIFIFIFIIAKS